MNLEDLEKILIVGDLISEKLIVFESVLSEFKEISPEFETTFIEYEDFKHTLKSDYEYSGECLDIYQYFLEFEKLSNWFQKSVPMYCGKL